MLTRIVVIGVLVLAVLWLLRKSLGGRKPTTPADQNQNNQNSDSSASLIACAHCGVMLPKADAFWREGQSYCSITHRNLGPKR
jgi:uncharacterized protein